MEEENTAQVLSQNFWQTMVFSIEPLAPLRHNKMELLRGNIDFSKFLVDHGIFPRTTCPHASQQNGIPERKHRLIIETELSLLA